MVLVQCQESFINGSEIVWNFATDLLVEFLNSCLNIYLNDSLLLYCLDLAESLVDNWVFTSQGHVREENSFELVKGQLTLASTKDVLQLKVSGYFFRSQTTSACNITIEHEIESQMAKTFRI